MTAAWGRVRLGVGGALFALALGLAADAAVAAERRFPEPPPPTLGKSWPQVREDQISFMERLKLWGISVEVAHKDEVAIQDTPSLAVFKASWTSPDRISITIGARTPSQVKGLEFKGEYHLTIDPEAMSHAASIEAAIPGWKLSGEVKSASDRGLGVKMAGEFERSLLGLKGEIGNASEEHRALELSLNLGVAKIKLDPFKYAQRFVTFVPRFAVVAQRPAEQAARAAVDAVGTSLNPGLAVAVLADKPLLWLRQMQLERAALEKARAEVIASFVAPIRQEITAWQTHVAEANSTARLVTAQDQQDHNLVARFDSYYRNVHSAEARGRPAPPPPPPSSESSGQDSGWSYSGSGGGGSGTRERDDSGGHQSIQIHDSPTLNLLRSGHPFSGY
jgi:hypothetical protein